MSQWFVQSPQTVIDSYDSSAEHGLTDTQVNQLKKKFGLNALPEPKGDTLLGIFLHQFKSPLIYILLACSIVVFLLGEHKDSLIILFVLLFNAVVGSIQEGRAQNTLRALRQLTQTNATVIRNGKKHIIPDQELVPGDIVLLHEGEKIPADGRVIEEHNLSVNESALTGESVPVHKVVTLPKTIDIPTTKTASVPLGDQKTMVFRGTFVTAGYGKVIITETGLSTVIGKLTEDIQDHQTEIPLQVKIRQLVHWIVITVGIVSIAVFVLGLTSGYPAREIFGVVVSLAVSSIPEGLPVVLTVVLATGLWRMSKRNALVKKLQAVEALGQTTIIAVDKTGTITKNQLMVTKLYESGKLFNIEGTGYETTGRVLYKNEPVDPQDYPSLLRAGEVATFCASAQIEQDSQTMQWKITGDPTEAALLVLAHKLGFDRSKHMADYSLVTDQPFDYEKKYHLAVYKTHKQQILAVTGAPEILIEKSQVDEREKKKLLRVLHELSSEGLRVVAFAYKELTGKENITDPKNLTFGGFYAMQDALHEEVPAVVAQIKSANMKLVMITGDYRQTAESIATQAGIFKKGDQILTGADIDSCSPGELSKKLRNVTVFSRVSPFHKEKIIEAYRLRGDTIAMTGDGVNDSLSLVAADVGIALGRSGTEVAKEAADIVLLDDNLKSIVAAIEEGRGIYKTIQKVILYLFSTSMGETLVIIGSLVLGLAIPLNAAQIIWLNLVTDGFLDISLAMEPQEENLLHQHQSKKAPLFTGKMLRRMIFMGTIMMIGCLTAYLHTPERDPIRISSYILTLMAAFQWFNAWNCRHELKSNFAMNPFANKYLIAATVVIIALQVAALNLPFFQAILHTQPLSLAEWGSIILIASSILWAEEIRKAFSRLKA